VGRSPKRERSDQPYRVDAYLERPTWSV